MTSQPSLPATSRPRCDRPFREGNCGSKVAVGEAVSVSAGFTLSEVIIVLFVISLLATISLRSVLFSVDRADLAHTLVELRGIQAAMWHESTDGQNFALAARTWEDRFAGSDRDSYFVLVNQVGGADDGGDAAARVGAGEDGAVGAGRTSFVVVCPRRFNGLAEYVYIEDEGPPQLVTDPANDPGYLERLGWNRDGLATGAAGGATRDTGFSWTGSRGPHADGSVAAGAGAVGSAGFGSGGGAAIGSATGSGRAGGSSSSRIPD
jgi:prepilin-type N-terminal cleavage/methylation domain-containing protein